MFVLFACVLALCLSPAASFGQPSGQNEHLAPGRLADLDERVPVNFVFVGYDRDDVAAKKFLAGLPREYKPVVRSRLSYNNHNVERSLLGLNYTYDYKTYYANEGYQSRFFRHLSTISKPAPLTEYQLLYNGNDKEFCDPPDEDPQNPVPCQQNGVRDVRNNHYIDAPSVERWLAYNPPKGVDTRRNTVFFINWWGNGTQPRAGFEHHVYTKTDESDPDTGYNFGAESPSRKLIAWGGTTADDEESGLGSTRRVWFHDLSAGPDSTTDNWNVDDPDLTGDGKEDYRLPPVWEYFAPGGYRDASKLTGDLSRLSRYVAIDLFFTSSPLYPPQFTPQLLPNRVNLDVNTLEGWPGVDASQRYQTPGLVRDEIDELHRLPYSIDQQDLAYSGKARECYLKWLTSVNNPDAAEVCYAQYRNYPPDANLFLYGATNLGRLLDDEQTAREYEAVLLNWAVEDGPRGLTSPPVLGFADDNYRNGTQSFVFSFISPGIVKLGYGLSTTEIHEYGHHLNLSHPFDGFDYQTKTDYGPKGPYYLALTGNEVNSTMSYVDLNWDFSQFDRDNTNRFQAAGYINNANALAKRILASPGAGRAEADLRAADRYYGQAKSALARHDYYATFDNAKRAYESVLKGAHKAGVKVEASNDGRTASPTARASSRIPGDYIDKPQVVRGIDPMAKHGIQSLSPPAPEAYTPFAHRMRR
jgi:hypothetical protein